MFGTVKLIIAAIIVGALLGAGWYITGLRANLAISEENNKKLADGIKEQTALLEQMKADIATIQETNKQLAEQNEKQKKDVDALTSKFDKRDFGAFAASKPDVVEKLINRGTENAMRCFELAAGAPLNEKEKQAKSPTEANRECPALINPSYKPITP